jgi:hypothetical protein
VYSTYRMRATDWLSLGGVAAVSVAVVLAARVLP